MDEAEERTVWDAVWAKTVKDERGLRGQLSSRFTREAYLCLREFVAAGDRRMLEAGCGTGRLCCLLAEEFEEAIVVGIDISKESIRIASRLKGLVCSSDNLIFGRGDLFSLPFADSCFDITFGEGVIEHFGALPGRGYKDAVKEMVRVTKPGGKVVVAVPNWYCFPHTAYKAVLRMLGRDYEYGYERSFTHRELKALFSGLGLQNLQLSGWYPAHGFYRLDRYSSFFRLPGKLVDLVQAASDRLIHGYFSKMFGFEIMIGGEKA